jgi:hypothetical protein
LGCCISKNLEFCVKNGGVTVSGALVVLHHDRWLMLPRKNA